MGKEAVSVNMMDAAGLGVVEKDAPGISVGEEKLAYLMKKT